MNNIVHVYHIRDPYDHSLGYTVYNSYTDLVDETIKELITKQDRYMKSPDIGGYWLQVITYQVNGEHTIEDHIKTLPQKTRIELNLKAKGTGKRKSMTEAFAAINGANIMNGALLAPAVVNNAALDINWQGGENVVIEFEEDQEEHN